MFHDASQCYQQIAPAQYCRKCGGNHRTQTCSLTPWVLDWALNRDAEGEQEAAEFDAHMQRRQANPDAHMQRRQKRPFSPNDPTEYGEPNRKGGGRSLGSGQ